MKQYGAAHQLNMIEANVSSAADVPAAAQSLVGRVDVIFVPADNTAQSGLASVVKVCETNKIPLFTSDHASVKAGAISAYSYTEQDVGKATGTVVARVIKGERAGTITVQIPTDYKLSINLTSAQAMGLSIPDSLRASADIVYP